MKENIIKFLEGKYSLGHSYWVVGILGSIGVGIPLFLVMASDVNEMSSFSSFLVVVYYFFISFIVSVLPLEFGRVPAIILIKISKQKYHHFGVMQQEPQ
jgi:hypothetical protein